MKRPNSRSCGEVLFFVENSLFFIFQMGIVQRKECGTGLSIALKVTGERSPRERTPR